MGMWDLSDDPAMDDEYVPGDIVKLHEDATPYKIVHVDRHGYGIESLLNSEQVFFSDPGFIDENWSTRQLTPIYPVEYYWISGENTPMSVTLMTMETSGIVNQIECPNSVTAQMWCVYLFPRAKCVVSYSEQLMWDLARNRRAEIARGGPHDA